MKSSNLQVIETLCKRYRYTKQRQTYIKNKDIQIHTNTQINTHTYKHTCTQISIHTSRQTHNQYNTNQHTYIQLYYMLIHTHTHTHTK